LTIQNLFIILILHLDANLESKKEALASKILWWKYRDCPDSINQGHHFYQEYMILNIYGIK